ncbi:MAG: hypothetical protein LBF63_01890 [Treponema sp.]|jgi:hypothetical protein|nr:hypothetical protein [Treponema sp.]
MRKIIILLLASLCLLFSCDLGVGENPLAKAASSTRIPEDFLGVIAGEVGISSDGVDATKADVEYDFVEYLGAKWILATFYWERIQKGANPDASSDDWDWRYYDNFVNTVHAKGFKVFAVLAYENNAVTGDSGTYISPDKYPLFANYVTQVIERYGDKIAGYSIWNEPNEIPRFWEGSPEEIIALSLTAVAAARSALAQHNPNGKLIVWPVNSLAVEDWTTGFFGGIMGNAPESLLAIDGVAYHPYMPGGQRAADLFSAHQSLVSQWGFDRKIWVTEAGFPTGGRYVSLVKEDNMPEEVIKTITLLAARGAAHVFWYQLFDPADKDVENSEDYFGLADYNSSTNAITKKKGADAFALCGKYIPGALYQPDLAVTGSGIQAYWFQGPEESALILWADTKAVGDTVPVTVTLPGTDWMRRDIVTGEGAEFLEETIDVGKTPVFLSWKLAAKSVPSVRAP